MTEVVRVGNTVHRAMGPWSPTIHDLLRYLEKQEFEGAPRLQTLCTLIAESAKAGNSAFQKQIEEGHLAMYRRELLACRWYYPRLQQNMSRL